MRVAISLILALSLASCAAGPKYASIGSERASSAYRKVVMNIGTTMGRPGQEQPDNNVPLAIYLRVFASEKMVSFCGYYVIPETTGGIERQITQKLMENANIFADDLLLTSTLFLRRQTPQQNEYDAEASCVRTSIPTASVSPSSTIRVVLTPVRIDL